jgi:hypothetical protein
MQRYEVVITGKNLEWAQHALHDVGIETATGPDRFLGRLGELLRLGGRMSVLLEADSEQDAEDRVRDALPEDRYKVGPSQVKPLG